MGENMKLFNNRELILDELLKSFDRTKNSLEEDVEILENWMKNQPHLPEILDTKTLQNFLILNKFSIEKTKQKIDMYFTVRSKLVDIYGQINPKLPHMQEITRIVYLFVHPQVTQDAKRVCFLKMRDKSLVDKLEPCNLLRGFLNIQEVRMRHDVTNGGIFVLDCDEFPLYLALKVSPLLIYNIVITIYENVFSSRLGAIYLLNFPPFFETLLQMFKKVMKPKLFQRIHLCSNVDELKEYFPSDFLPKEFGGEGPSCDELQELLEEKFRECQDLFDHLDKIRVDESRRPEELRNDETLGFYGNFKKLDID